METNNLLKQALQKAYVKPNEGTNTDSALPIQDNSVKADNINDVLPIKEQSFESISTEVDWQRFSFTCSKAIVKKIHNIVTKEGFTLRQVMELFLQRGIDDYEKKYGKIDAPIKDISKLL